MLITPAGMPAASTASASRAKSSWVSEDGLTTTVLPAASAGASLKKVRVCGKFQGTIAATTPSGVRWTREVPPRMPGRRSSVGVCSSSVA
jgi:hypothetical protein